MSVTIVSTPSAPTPATATDSGGGTAATGQDFANLLLGQLAVGVAQAVVPAALQGDAALADSAPVDTLPTDIASTDAASLLASLGLAMAPASTSTATPIPIPSGKTGTDASSAVSTAAAGPSLKAEDQTASLKTTSLKADPVLTGTAATDDKAAKFAVAPAAVDDALSAKAVSTDVANSVAPLSANASGNANTAAVQHDATSSLATPVRDQRWATDFSQKIVWLAAHDKQSAQLTLNPAHMGPIEISLNMDNGNASVSFASANAEVRDAIETALPRLREMFASAGIELGQANVSSESFKQPTGSGEQYQSSSRSTTDNAILAENSPAALQARTFGTPQGNGLVNIFA